MPWQGEDIITMPSARIRKGKKKGQIPTPKVWEKGGKKNNISTQRVVAVVESLITILTSTTILFYCEDRNLSEWIEYELWLKVIDLDYSSSREESKGQRGSFKKPTRRISSILVNVLPLHHHKAIKWLSLRMGFQRVGYTHPYAFSNKTNKKVVSDKTK